MALGGGTFISQNKILPGSYINFVSAAKATASLSDRGVVAFPIEMGWGAEGQVISVTAGDFQKNSLKIFGYAYTDDALKGIRDIFANAKEALFYRLNTGGDKAENTYCTAKYAGTRGNQLKTVITNSETASKFDVATYFGTVLVDEQKAVTSTSELIANDYVDWKATVSLALTAGLPLEDGTDGSVSDATYQAFLDAIESYSFNAIGTVTTSGTIKGLFANFTKRMRDEVGVKFQCVLHQYTTANHEGIISVENNSNGNLCYWVAGAIAGCAVNKSLTNAIYTGEYAVEADYTQAQLEAAILAGKFIFHKVNDTIRVLEDINTFISTTDTKGDDFKNNQTIRVLDQIGNDIASLFNTKYLGQVPNDGAGRISLWNDIVKHHQELQVLRAIENFEADDVTVAPGDSKGAVVVTDYVTPVNAMAQLYMTVIVE